jgi:glutamate racemase
LNGTEPDWVLRTGTTFMRTMEALLFLDGATAELPRAPRGVDLLAGRLYGPGMAPASCPTVLVFDSGLGGLTVYRELARTISGVGFVYAADDAGFPYGRLAEPDLIARVVAVMDRLVARHRPDLVVIACNTASTLVLPALRARFKIPFVGTVPAIKPAAAMTRTGRIAVLGTPGTVRRDYTRALIESYAGGASVDLIGATRLAGLAEAALRGEPLDREAVAAEIAPCFCEDDGRRTDVVVLACTHYPLLLPLFRELAPWPVEWLDPAPAIARRVADLLGEGRAPSRPAPAPQMIFTRGGTVPDALREALRGEGLGTIDTDLMPLA